jgi:hypothetical protein
MSNTSYRYLQLKDMVPINEYSWNGTARYMVHPKSKYGGFALKFQSMIDRAILNSDRDMLRRLMTSEPDFLELDKVRDQNLKEEVLRSIRKREKSVYGIVIPINGSFDEDVKATEIFSRTNIVIRVASRRETNPLIVKYVQNNFPRELELARNIM